MYLIPYVFPRLISQTFAMKHDPFLYLGEISHPMAFQGGTKTLVNPVGYGVGQ